MEIVTTTKLDCWSILKSILAHDAHFVIGDLAGFAALRLKAFEMMMLAFAATTCVTTFELFLACIDWQWCAFFRYHLGVEAEAKSLEIFLELVLLFSHYVVGCAVTSVQ